MRIGVAGIGGRVGSLLAEIIPARGETLSGGTVRPGQEQVAGATRDIAALASISDVVIDFTPAGATIDHAAALADAGTAWVIGTTGLDAEAEAAILAAAARIPIVQAANFSPGVNLMLVLARRLAAQLASSEYDAEIVETHHRAKRDAPSGTALAIGRAVAAGRGQALGDVAILGRQGETGPRAPGAIGFASLRAGAIVGEHTLSFTSESEQITIGDRVFDRRVFAEGALRAARWVHGRAPGLYDMEDVLELG